MDELETAFAEHAKNHPYFKKFLRVSEKLFNNFGQPGGVAHTDIVKCASLKWPPGGANREQTEQIVANCLEYLMQQVVRLKPKVIICNGVAVCQHMQSILPPNRQVGAAPVTKYTSTFDNHSVEVILSGFIGRIDNCSRRRLGLEIEKTISRLGINLWRSQNQLQEMPHE